MNALFEAFRHLSRTKRVVVIVMLLLIIATWVGVCLVLASYLA